MRVGAGEGKTIQSDSTPGKSASLPNFIFSQALLTADFEIGHYIRERIVPRAVLFFTGEALEDESDCEEEESDEDDDDDEVFVKKGRHGSENGSAKKPLIKGDDQNISI